MFLIRRDLEMVVECYCFLLNIIVVVPRPRPLGKIQYIVALEGLSTGNLRIIGLRLARGLVVVVDFCVGSDRKSVFLASSSSKCSFQVRGKTCTFSNFWSSWASTIWLM